MATLVLALEYLILKATYYNYQLSKVGWKFGHQVLM